MIIWTREIHDAGRTKAHRGDLRTKTWHTIDMRADSLARPILIDDDLIRYLAHVSFTKDPCSQRFGPLRQWWGGQRRTPGGLDGTSAVVVAMSVVLDPTPEFARPGRYVDVEEQ